MIQIWEKSHHSRNPHFSVVGAPRGLSGPPPSQALCPCVWATSYGESQSYLSPIRAGGHDQLPLRAFTRHAQTEQTERPGGQAVDSVSARKGSQGACILVAVAKAYVPVLILHAELRTVASFWTILTAGSTSHTSLPPFPAHGYSARGPISQLPFRK